MLVYPQLNVRASSISASSIDAEIVHFVAIEEVTATNGSIRLSDINATRVGSVMLRNNSAHAYFVNANFSQDSGISVGGPTIVGLVDIADNLISQPDGLFSVFLDSLQFLHNVTIQGTSRSSGELDCPSASSTVTDTKVRIRNAASTSGYLRIARLKAFVGFSVDLEFISAFAMELHDLGQV